jgi:hypothetical protein
MWQTGKLGPAIQRQALQEGRTNPAQALMRLKNAQVLVKPTFGGKLKPQKSLNA